MSGKRGNGELLTHAKWSVQLKNECLLSLPEEHDESRAELCDKEVENEGCPSRTRFSTARI